MLKMFRLQFHIMIKYGYMDFWKLKILSQKTKITYFAAKQIKFRINS